MRWLDDTNEDNCARFGLDPDKVSSLARKLSKLGREAKEMGIIIFGGSTGGSLRPMNHHGAQNILATLDGEYDGGDGGDEY